MPKDDGTEYSDDELAAMMTPEFASALEALRRIAGNTTPETWRKVFEGMSEDELDNFDENIMPWLEAIEDARRELLRERGLWPPPNAN